MKKIGYGNTAEVYEYGDGKVLKLYDFQMPEYACESEYIAMKYIYEKSGICPKPYELIRLNGRIGIIMEKIDGIDYLNLIIKKPWTCKKIMKDMAHLQKIIHIEVDDELPNVKDKMVEMISQLAANELDSKIVNKILETVYMLPGGNTLCHGDYHPGNILVNNERSVAIDWMTALRGNELYDVAKTFFMIQYSEIYIRSKIIFFCSERIRASMAKVYLEEYMKTMNIKIEEIQKWFVPVAASMLYEPICNYERKKLNNIILNWYDTQRGGVK